MVFRSVERIRETLPDIIHVVMFYDDGTVYQTTFSEEVDIPGVGKNLAESVDHMEKFFDLIHLGKVSYTKFIFETVQFLVIVLRLGEQSNIALFFKKSEEEPKISTIRRYLYRIESLVDTDRLDLEKKKLEQEKQDLKALEQEIQGKLEQIENKKGELYKLDETILGLRSELEEKKLEIGSEDLIREKFEDYIEQREEFLDRVQKKEVEKEIKTEIKEDKKSLSAMEKDLQKEEKSLDKIDDRIQKIEEDKQDILSEITRILEDINKLKERVTEKTEEITAHEAKIQRREKERFERELIMEKLYE